MSAGSEGSKRSPHGMSPLGALELSTGSDGSKRSPSPPLSPPPAPTPWPSGSPPGLVLGVLELSTGSGAPKIPPSPPPSPPPTPTPSPLGLVLELSTASDVPKRSASAEPRSTPELPVPPLGGAPAAPGSSWPPEELEPPGGVFPLKSNVCRRLLSAGLDWAGCGQRRRMTRRRSAGSQNRRVELPAMVTNAWFWNDRSDTIDH